MAQVNSAELKSCIKEKDQAFPPAKSQADAAERNRTLKNLCTLQLSEPAQCEGSLQEKRKCATDHNNQSRAKDYATQRANDLAETLKALKR